MLLILKEFYLIQIQLFFFCIFSSYETKLLFRFLSTECLANKTIKRKKTETNSTLSLFRLLLLCVLFPPAGERTCGGVLSVSALSACVPSEDHSGTSRAPRVRRGEELFVPLLPARVPTERPTLGAHSPSPPGHCTVPARETLPAR